MNSGIYELANTISSKRYVGSAMDFKARWRAHRKLLRRRQHPNRKLQAAWGKHGEQAFEFRKLLVCKPELLLFYEQLCLDGLKPEYNIRSVAESNLGLKLHDAAARGRISARHRGHKYNAGRVHSAESRAKIAIGVSRALRGRPKSPEHRAKLSAALKGRPRSTQPA